jgi:hypothetical protein
MKKIRGLFLLLRTGHGHGKVKCEGNNWALEFAKVPILPNFKEKKLMK